MARRPLPLRVPTLLSDGPQPREEVCYLALPAATLTVAELIAAKVLAELRKVRLGASPGRVIAPLAGPGYTLADEALLIRAVALAFTAGRLHILVDGRLATSLAQQVELAGHSVVLFCPREPRARPSPGPSPGRGPGLRPG